MLYPTLFGRKNLRNWMDDFFDDDDFFGKDAWNDFFAPVAGNAFTGVGGMGCGGLMRADVIEKENAYELAVDLPGFSKEEVCAELKDGYLTIKAAKKQEKDEKENNKDIEKDGVHYLRRERLYGACQRSFRVGDKIKKEDIKANFKDGILTIEIPKVEKEKEIEENHSIHIG